NVRELENTMERAVALETEPQVSVGALPDKISRFHQDSQRASGTREGEELIPGEGIEFEALMNKVERSYLLAALERAEGVQKRAADILGMTYASFRHYAKKHQI
ncbi:MAG: sigma-54-dependent Fis family transcriptional regulator, partial [Acidobacteria bacterium]|nr:sigma-54-dependent Fis family transcriptional regulator [Acidobacteriota bacterium]